MIPSSTTATASTTANHSHSQALFQNHLPSPVAPAAAPAPVRIFKREDRISYPGANGGPTAQLQPPPIRNPAPPASQMQSAAVSAPGTVHHRYANPKTATTLVIELAKYHKLNPEFKLIQTEGPSHCPTFTMQCSIGECGSATATGPSIKKATVAAAEALLQTVALPFPPPKTAYRGPAVAAAAGAAAGDGIGRKPRPRGPGVGVRRDQPQPRMPMAMNSCAPSTMSSAAAASFTESPVSIEKNPISLLNEYCTRNKKILSYTLIEERGPPHSKVFRMRCVVDDVLSAEGEGCTKQLAKTEASKEMVQQIPELTGTGVSHGGGAGGELVVGAAAGVGRGKAYANANRKSKPRLKIIREDGGVATTGSDSPINKLAEFALHSGLGEPKYDCWEEDPVSVTAGAGAGGRAAAVAILNKKKVFVVQARVGAAGGYVAVGKSFRKQDAKSSAAASLLQALNQQQRRSQNSIQNQNQRQNQGAMTDSAPAPLTSPPSGPPSHQGATAPASPPVTGHQLKPGLIVLNKPNDHEHTDKLSYLADLIGFRLSFADFPKKDEYLSVLSLSTDPPHVAHGLGKTLVEARNQASLKILDELKETGLESGPNSK